MHLTATFATVPLSLRTASPPSLCHRLNCRTCATAHKACMPVARAAVTRVVEHSTSLTAVSLTRGDSYTSAPLMLFDLAAAGSASGLPTRLRKLAVDFRADDPLQLRMLQEYTSLTCLDIVRIQIGEWHTQYVKASAVALKEAFQSLLSLKFLRLQHCRLKREGTAALASALQALTQLQHLLLPSNELRRAGVAALVPALSAMPGLQTVDVSSNHLYGVKGVKVLCALLDVVPGLTHLDVGKNSLREDAALLAPALRCLTCLRVLNMSNVCIGDKDMDALAPALAALPHLHTLDVSRNDLRSEAMFALQQVLAREGSPLHKLDISWNWCRSKSACAVAAGLSASLQLQVLNLEGADWGKEGWAALGPALSRLAPTLQSLRLHSYSSRSGTAGTAVAAADALQALTGLTLLQAPRIFASVDMEAVTPALMGMVRLQYLNLAQTPMGVEGTAAFAKVLPAFASSLKFLNLSQCSIDAEAASRVLAPTLAQVTGLAGLYLHHHDVGPQGAQWLVSLLSTLPHLRTIGLCSCGLGVQGCMAIVQAVKERDEYE